MYSSGGFAASAGHCGWCSRSPTGLRGIVTGVEPGARPFHLDAGAMSQPPPPEPHADTVPTLTPDRAALAATIAEEEARQRRLETEHAEAEVRVDTLRAKLAALDQPPTDRSASSGPIAMAPRSPREKVRFVSKKTLPY